MITPFSQAPLPFDEATLVTDATQLTDATDLTDASRLTVAPVGSGSVDYIRHPRARRYVIRVREDGTVRVTIPRWGSKRAAREFAEEQRAWIENQRDRVQENREQSSANALPPGVVRGLRERARRELPARLLEIAAEHGIAVARVSVRNQRWRWGSCSTSGHISLNWRLIGMPAWVRDYVMIHELMHLRRMDHSPKFWKLVAAACPSYREAREWLRANRRCCCPT